MAALYTVLFVIVLFLLAYPLIWLLDKFAIWRGWYTEPLRKRRWFDKLLDDIDLDFDN